MSKLIVIGSVMSDTLADVPCGVQQDDSGLTFCIDHQTPRKYA